MKKALYILIAAVLLWQGWRAARRTILLPDLEIYEVEFIGDKEEERSLAEWKGKPVLINFYASWCGPCMREMPTLEKAHQELQKQGVQVIGLTDDNSEKIDQVREHFNITFPLYELDKDLLGIGIFEIPQTVAISSKGEILFRHEGEKDWASPKFLEEYASKW